MLKIYKYQYLILMLMLIAGITLSSKSIALDLFDKKEDPDYIWRAGLNQYFKYTPQEDNKYGPNDQPVDLDSREISTALEALVILDKRAFSSEIVGVPVFPPQQLKLLGDGLSRGLKNARPDQDIIFVMQKSSRKLLLLSERAMVAGRAFYKDGMLNIIIGDYDLARNDALESVYDPSGKGNIPYTFNFGSRSSTNSGFKEDTEQVPGIVNKLLGNKILKNWFIIDTKVAAQAQLAKLNNKNNKSPGYDDEALKQEAEKLARERRQLRLEMAKMRKEMQEGTNSQEMTVEQRLKNLDELLEKKLITEEEYAQKRKEILGDI